MNYLLIGKYIFLPKLTDPEYVEGKVNGLLKDNHMNIVIKMTMLYRGIKERCNIVASLF